MAYWLSEPVESLLEAIDSGKTQATCDVLVVGSGYGGAIAAMRLAGAGRRVILFERGKEYALGDFPENLGELPGHVRFMRASDPQPLGYAGALFDLRIADKVAALVGNGLGGGSLINANVALKPTLATLKHQDWPKGVRDFAKELRDLMDHVGQRWLGVVRDQRRPGKLEALDRLAKAMGVAEGCDAAPVAVSFDGGCNVIGVEQSPCVRCGNCVTGCNVGAKNTLAMNLLPLAKKRGARIYTGATVISVEPAGDPTGKGGWTVRYRRTATEKGALREEVYELHARVVVLAAGTLGSTEILLRSRARKKIRCSDQLGKRFSTNGDTIALSYGQRMRVGAVATSGSLDRAPKEVGPTISGCASVTLKPESENAPARTLLLEDGAVPVSLARLFAELAVSGSLIKRYLRLANPAWFDAHPEKDPLAIHPDALQHSQLLLGMGDDGAAGELRLRMSAGEVDASNADDARLAILWPDGEGTVASRFLNATDQQLRAAEEKGFDGGNYIQNPAWRPLPAEFAAELTGEAPEGPMLTVHPLGGCPMGEDGSTGVVDEFGQVFRVPRERDGPTKELYAGLYIMDGAIIPRALGVNPFLTIAALAWRANTRLLRTLGWTESATEHVGLERPPRSRCEVPTQREQVSAAIVERLLGSLDAVPGWFRAAAKGPLAREDWLAAEIRIELPDLDAWLANPDSDLSAVCDLYANKQDSDTFDRENLIPVAEKIRGTVKLLARDGPADDAQARRRAAGALLAYFERNGMPGAAKSEQSERGSGLWRVACNHAHWRVLEYRFAFRLPGDERTWLLKGRKELAYSLGKPNLWTALIELPVELTPENARFDERYRGVLKVDLIDLSKRALAQIGSAEHTPAALMALTGMGMLTLRVLFQTHFWSLRAPDYGQSRPGGSREPDPIRSHNGSTVKPVRIPFFVPAGREGEEPLALRFWRYPHPEVPRADKILLIHGLAHGANVFATRTITRPLAAYLHDEGYEVWLLDFRLSPALEKASRRQSTMDEIARHDIAEAVRHVYREAGEPIRVFAHCIGAGCFSMSVLAGYCHDSTRSRSMIKAAAIHAVPPWVVPSKSNRLRANLAAFAKDVIGQVLVDPIPPDSGNATFAETIIDRLAGSLPWPYADLAAHDHDRDHAGTGRAICNRMTLFYGVEWVHANLSEATHRNIAALVGVGNIETFRQIFFIAQRQRITDRQGRNVYLTLDNIKNHWKFPTLFAHGDKNQVFSPMSSRRSAVRLQIVQKEHGYPNQDVYFEEIPGYGHMDFLFGAHAYRDVYPKIGDFFSASEERRMNLGRPKPEQDPRSAPPAKPLVGPIIGYARAQGGTPVLRVWIEAHDDVTTAPMNAVFHALLEDGSWRRLASQTETPIPDKHDRHWYVVSEVTVDEPSAKAINVAVTYYDPPVYIKLGQRAIKPKGVTAERVFSRTPPVPGAKIHLDAPWFRRLAGVENPGGCTFLAGSCRHPGSPFEREASDRIFAAMLKEVKAGADHVLLAGDQIYADATADVFDTREPGERYSGRYRDAYASKNAAALIASVPVYMAIDDHEFGDNWQGMPCSRVLPVDESTASGPDDLFEIARNSAMSYQRVMGPDLNSSLWYEFTSAANLPFFVMDSRSERCLRRRYGGPQGARMVQAEQMKALEQWLAKHAKRAEPKFIVCGSPIGPVTIADANHPSLWRNSDWWFGYPHTLGHLVDMMVQVGPKNLYFISGDYHFSAVADLVFYSRDGRQVEAKQIIASGLFSPMPFANEQPENFSFDKWAVVPVAGSTASVGVKASLLARSCSHFLRVTAARDAGGTWTVTPEAIGADCQRIDNAC